MWRVGHVEHFGAELEVQHLGDRDYPEEAEIPVVHAAILQDAECGLDLLPVNPPTRMLD